MYSQNGEVIRSEDFRDATLIAKHTYDNGELLRTEHVKTLDGHELVTHITRHRPHAEVFYPIQLQGVRTFISPFGEIPLSIEQTECLLASLNSKNDYDAFEELFWDQFASATCNNEPLRDIVLKRGRALYGIDRELNKLETLQKNSGLSFQIRLDTLPGQGSRVKLREASRVIPELVQAINLYPPQYLKNSSLISLYIISNIQPTEAVPDPDGIYSSTQRLIALRPPREKGLPAKTVFHHEFLHYCDDVTGGLNNHSDWERRFHGNGKLPNGDNVYGLKGYGWEEYPGQYAPEGFVRDYGRRNPNEDLATIAEALLSPGLYKDLREQIAHDPILREKIDLIKRGYFLRSSGRMDNGFWKVLDSGIHIDSAYWDRREKRGDFQTDEIRALEHYNSIGKEQAKLLKTTSLLDEWTEKKKNDVEQEKVLNKWRAIAKEMVEQDPYNSVPWYILVQSYNLSRLDKVKLAKMRPEQITYLKKRLRILPVQDHEPSYYSDLAELYADEGQMAKAKECYKEAIKLFPRDSRLQECLSDLNLANNLAM